MNVDPVNWSQNFLTPSRISELLESSCESKGVIKAGIIGLAAMVLGCGTYYICSKLKSAFTNWQDENIEQVDPAVAKIMGILQKSEAFHKFIAENPNLLQKVKIHAYSQQECLRNGIKNARTSYVPASWFSNASLDIFFDRSLPVVKQIRGVLIELCNAIHIQEFAELKLSAKKGLLNRERYIYLKEQTEWNAAKDAFKIAEAIDAFNLFKNETVFNLLGKEANKNFDLYLQIQKQSGHSEKCGEHWDAISKSDS